MAAERKLKAEIDRTLKKVQEGQEIFDDIWNQYSAHKQAHDQDNQNQREKLEGELKKEIKKLQRLREQIKGWIAGADIKDKQPLIDARKSIERDMERFKACEKEAKAKGSAAGGSDRDPKQRAKDEARDWINTVVDQLTEKVETMEAEMEELQVTVKKRQKPPARLTALEETVGRHKDHIERLEKVLRCIDNETIQPDELGDLKEDMDCYLGTEDGEDNGMDLSNVDDMYGLFQDRLDAVDNAAPAAPLHSVKHGKSGREKEAEEAREKERERERAAAAAAKAQLIAQGNTNLKLHDDDEVRKPSAAGVGGSGSAGLIGSSGKSATSGAATPGGTAGGLPMSVPSLAAPPPAGARQTAPSTPVKEPESGSVTPRNAVQPLSAASPGGMPPSEAASPLPSRPSAAGGAMAGTPGPLAGPAGASQPPPPPGVMPGGGPRTPSAAAAAAAAATANGSMGSNMDGGMPRWLAAAAPGGHAGGPAAGAGGQQDAVVDGRGAAVPEGPAGALQGGVGPAPGPGSGPASAVAGGAYPGVPSASGTVGPSADGPTGQFAAGGAGPVRQSVGGPADRGAVGPAGPGPGGMGPLDALAARMAGVGLGGAAGPGPGSGAASAMALSSHAAPSAAGAAGGSGASNGGGLLPGDLPPVASAYSVAAAKQILEACYARGVMPQLSDTEWKHTRPRHPVAVPASYPKSAPEVVDNPALFRKMDPECLFFAFYFQPNTYQQFLAAHELKRQSWRFHRHHNAWFQRFTEPAVTSEEYEQGAYVYFDYNIVHDDMQTGWCYRRKENFTFRYDALEDELRVANLTPQQTVAMAMAQVQGL
ncbi:hypothetical protein Agub_g2606 [Astrephomene gubernaculifera]|uniref:CCR4-NOT transcription complex subunit 3 n=1 Tax=Astrephomene gubernaculifera TaxID=47775 RepID=A0AAD3DHB4_9CHLO|nr:hypothetical protein Agub_g2606 [Astrephomene gubernaculifera]